MHCLTEIGRPSLPLTVKVLGWVGEVSKSGQKLFGLRAGSSVAELDIAVTGVAGRFGATAREPEYVPAGQSRLQLYRQRRRLVGQTGSWQSRDAAGDLLESCEYRETFREQSERRPR